MVSKLAGGCLCGQVEYAVEDKFSQFYLCHCKQCQQMTGSSNAANLFTEPDNIDWLKGEQNIVCDEKASWLESGLKAKSYAKFPE